MKKSELRKIIKEEISKEDASEKIKEINDQMKHMGIKKKLKPNAESGGVYKIEEEKINYRTLGLLGYAFNEIAYSVLAGIINDRPEIQIKYRWKYSNHETDGYDVRLVYHYGQWTQW